MTRYLPLLLLVGVLAFVSFAQAQRADAAFVPAYMTTGGWFNDPNMLTDPTQKITFGGTLQCDGVTDEPNSLIVHYRDQAEFRLQTVTSSSCTINDPDIGNSGGRLQGSGTGVCNGLPATALLFQFNDDGQGNPNDNARFTISGAAPGCNFAVFATLLEGGQLTLHAVEGP